MLNTPDEGRPKKKRWQNQALLGGGLLVVLLVGGLLGVRALTQKPGAAGRTGCPSAPRSSAGARAPAFSPPVNTGSIREFPVPTPQAGPASITVGPDGNLWFTEQNADQIGCLTPQGAVTEFPLAKAPVGPVGITTGHDGNVWFTQPGANQIGRITPQGTITEFPLPSPLSGPWGMSAGPDGNVWFTERASTGGKIGRITPQGVITEFPLPPAQNSAGPISITRGPDGNLWFTNGNSIGRITPGGTVTLFPLPDPNSYLVGIAARADGTLWFTVFPVGGFIGHLGRITLAGLITFPLPTDFSEPAGITTGPDGALWFTEYGGGPSLGNRIWRLRPTAHSLTAQDLSAFPIPTPWSEPQDLTVGPDGALWFTEYRGNNIGRLLPSGP